MNRMKSCLAVLLALILATGSLQGPVFAAAAGQSGAVGAAAETGTVDPTKVTQTEPLKLQPEVKTYSVTIDMDGGAYLGSVHDEATGQDLTSPALFVWKVTKGESLTFDVVRISYQDSTREFVGWSLTRNGDILPDSTSFTPTQDCTLYAVWRVIKKVTSISLSNSSLSMNPGDFVALTTTVLPSDADDKSVTWSSSNAAVATVSTDGTVTAVGKGTAVITATAADGSGISAACDVTVKQPVTSITLNETTLSLEKGETATLSATVEPGDADNKSVTWSSSDDKVATVESNGTVTAVGKGTAVITATAADGSGISASCDVTVTFTQLVTGITLNETTLSLEKGETAELSASVEPSDADNKSVTWSTSDDKVATVESNGTVTAVGKGTAVITATAADGSGISASCDVTVTFTQLVTGITLNETTLSLEKGETAELSASVEPSDADNKSVTWSSSDDKVATVESNGTVTAVGKGTAVITATAADGSGISASCDVTVTFTQLVTGITLNETTLSLEKGETAELSASVEPSDADNKSVTWSTSDDKVATVESNGTVTAVGKGTAVITATAADGSGVSASCNVTVTFTQLVTSITLNETTLSLEKGETALLSATVEPSDADNKSVTWSTSDDKVATVSANGTVTAVGKGTAVITATAADGSGISASCDVTVTFTQLVTSITLNETTLSLEKGETAELSATVEPSDADNKSVTWSTSDDKVATVSEDGTVTAVGKGTAVITATAADGSEISASCDVTVTFTQLVTSISLNETSLSLEKGKTAELSATVEPSDADNKSVTWSTSDDKVATVAANGTVTAVGKGTAVITATAADGSGLTANCIVTVKQPVTSISLNKTTLSLEKGKTEALSATVLPSDADNKSVTWSTSNNKVATVDAKGSVKAVAKGTAVITVTAADGSGLTATCIVTVKQPVTSISLNKTTLSLKKGKTAALSAAVLPSDADDRSVIWSTSNVKVATVDAKGSVKAVAKGTVVITARAADGSGLTATCIVTVKQPVTKITLNKTSLTLNKGKSGTLKATVTPATADNKKIKWTTSNAKIATVSSKGVVKGINKGTVTITAAATDGSGKKASCKVTVKQPVTKLTINKSKLTLKLKKTAALKVTVLPSTANNKSIKWTTSNRKVATVTFKGVVKGVGKGKATIKAAAQDGSGKTVTCIVTVR